MSLRITDECLNCGACEVACPNTAIYQGGKDWKYADGTHLTGIETTPSGESVDADKSHKALQQEYYYVVEDKCTECYSFDDEPQCVAVCPLDVCVPSLIETEAALKEKVDWLFKGDTSHYDELREKEAAWEKEKPLRLCEKVLYPFPRPEALIGSDYQS